MQTQNMYELAERLKQLREKKKAAEQQLKDVRAEIVQTEYQLSMKVTIRNDKIVSITDVSGDGDAANDSYIKKAANGTSSKKGVVSQIITKGMPEEIDTVSRATCSSNAIIDGCKKALEMALRPEETEAQ